MGYDQPVELPWKGSQYSKHPPTLAWKEVMTRAQEGLEVKTFPTGGHSGDRDLLHRVGRPCRTALPDYRDRLLQGGRFAGCLRYPCRLSGAQSFLIAMPHGGCAS